MPAKDQLPSGNDLTKLTVPLLKALCKEKKIPGYSKLGKQALIQKLREASFTSGDPVIAVLCPLVPDSSGLSASNEVDLVTASPGVGDTQRGNTSAVPRISILADGSTSVSKGRSSAISPQKAITTQRKGKCKVPKAPHTGVSKLIDDAIPKSSSGTGASTLSALRNNVLAGVVGQSWLEPVDSPLASSGDSYSCRDARDNPVLKPALDEKKRKLSAPSAPPPASKRPRIQPQRPSVELPQPGLQINAHDPASKPLHPRLSIAADVSQFIHAPPAVTSNRCAISSSMSHAPRKRFKPLIVDKSRLRSEPSALPSAGAHAISSRPHGDTARQQGLDAPLYYLDFPVFLTPAPILRPISLPPPLAQRKRVAAWAVILSGLSDAERAVCVLVSRTFRYAVYLSATSTLNREYPGRRLQEDVFKQYSQAMTNMWPYLRLRQAEMTRRRCIYEASFVAGFFRRCGYDNPISQHLWASPDHPKQLIIAIRFALTRMWFELSVGTSSGTKEDPDSWLNSTISDVQEVVKSEIWAVSLVYPPSTNRAWKQETVYALEATCEVVGRLLKSPKVQDVATVPIRADWSAYVVQRSTSSSDESSLLSRLKWSCHEEYDRGMSRLWLSRIAQEGEVGVVKRSVAERYIFACVVGNSISGQWMTAHAMAQDFAGLPSRIGPATENKNKAVNLYLPEHHHVESVHFTTPCGEPLHSALAAVQTPHREYFILRDNGMQVGCEEEGVAAIWQEVLGCDRIGRASPS
ncbi:hypothetical protein C8Q73DRAFT_706477 [Cubamyces lactineus]|nr:hypothetical protein C8Q73DRAFT_706477 [Cubamyces lactineus]